MPAQGGQFGPPPPHPQGPPQPSPVGPPHSAGQPPVSAGAPSAVPGGWAPVQQAPKPVTPVPEPVSKKPDFESLTMPMSTSDEIPGREITATLGVAIGVTTRSRDTRIGPETVALLTRARQDALSALADMAESAGADAVVGLRFDGGQLADNLHEIAAYGTAVTLAPIPAPAVETEAPTSPEVTDDSSVTSWADATPGPGFDPHTAENVPMSDPDIGNTHRSPRSATPIHGQNPEHDAQLRQQYGQ